MTRPHPLSHEAADAAILEVLDTLRAGATMCPGELARRVGATQATLRPALVALADKGLAVITQRGAAADLRTLRGPYRVARKTSGK